MRHVSLSSSYARDIRALPLTPPARSPARLALKALPVRPGQLVSACPGMMSITRKRKLSLTLKQSLGEQVRHHVSAREQVRRERGRPF